MNARLDRVYSAEAGTMLAMSRYGPTGTALPEDSKTTLYIACCGVQEEWGSALVMHPSDCSLDSGPHLCESGAHMSWLT